MTIAVSLFRSPRVAAAAVVLLLTAACGGNDEVIDRAELEDSIATQLAEEVNQPKPNIDCPDDLDAEVGATIDCVLSVDGDEDTYGVHVVVESLEDGVANFDIKVSDEPLE